MFHGFPSASHIFRNLILQLEEKFSYTFDNLAKIIEKFFEKIGVEKFFMYVFDYVATIQSDLIFIDSGHFVLESHCKEISDAILKFF